MERAQPTAAGAIDEMSARVSELAAALEALEILATRTQHRLDGVEGAVDGLRRALGRLDGDGR